MPLKTEWLKYTWCFSQVLYELSQLQIYCYNMKTHALTHLPGRFMPVYTIKSADQLSTISLENHKHPGDMYLGLLRKEYIK